MSPVAVAVRTDHCDSFRVRAAQFFNVLRTDFWSITLLDRFNVRISRAQTQYQHLDSYTAHTSTIDNLLLSWRSMLCQTHQNVRILQDYLPGHFHIVCIVVTKFKVLSTDMSAEWVGKLSCWGDH